MYFVAFSLGIFAVGVMNKYVYVSIQCKETFFTFIFHHNHGLYILYEATTTFRKTVCGFIHTQTHKHTVRKTKR